MLYNISSTTPDVDSDPDDVGDLPGHTSPLPEETVPTSSSPVSSSPFAQTPPDDIISCGTTHQVLTGSSDPFSWFKNSQRVDTYTNEHETPRDTEGRLADDLTSPGSPHSSFATRLHELLLVVQRERSLSGTASVVSSQSGTPEKPGRTGYAEDISPPFAREDFGTPVGPDYQAGNVIQDTGSPDYWAYFPESTSLAIPCDTEQLPSLNGDNSCSSAYSHSEEPVSETEVDCPAYMQYNALSVGPCVDQRRSSFSSSLKRSLDPPGTALGLINGEPYRTDTSHGLESSAPQRKRTKKLVVDYPQSFSTRSRFFSRKPSLDGASMQRGALNGPCNHISPKRRMYAQRAASLRRADSLRSEVSSYARDSTDQATPRRTSLGGSLDSLSPIAEQNEGPDSDDEDDITSSLTPYAYIPTEPATPIPAPRRRALPGRIPTPPRSPLPVPLPIVAPPAFEEIPSAPLNEEDAAERRIRALMKREATERRADGLLCADQSDRECLLRSGDGKGAAETDDISKRRRDMSAPGNSEDPESRAILRQCASSVGNVDTEPGPVRSKFAIVEGFDLGIDEEIRPECVDWILEVLPDISGQPRRARKDLYEQLRDSSETRWHAAQLFTRYSLRLGSVHSHATFPASPSAEGVFRGSVSTEKALLMHDGCEDVIWDCAVACVVLSVKFHRDVFPPYYLIPAREFGALASHTMSYADLEAAQCDVLDALSHSVGCVTPGQYLHDLWLALPSLRDLLAFENGWQAAQEETWAILLEAFMQRGILRFPTSLLTACALIDGCVDVLIERYKVKVHTANPYKSRRRPSSGAGRLIRKDRNEDHRRQASKAVQSFKLDLQELLGYTEADVRYCRFWLRSAA
ncbi:uncharacterized protein C8Q71DRAFT_851168 [Rhodofomes roseus]|uniref:Uncharacterized protein n=1 Tax=Rhodofomes roseus TaxID=34475 RepID=A0ABQ8K285_9APHY|nr:uncharacterized protein C8Q71DRAFT_851168 [Rhodofomes roseus]KAH9830610.1 hypothetical protein C8Q71DRAFT_851168 [Rhodofomes roseus]